METKHQRITNLRYRQFLDEGIIQILTEEEIIKILQNIKGRNIPQAEAYS